MEAINPFAAVVTRPTTTKWKNPTSQVVRLRLCTTPRPRFRYEPVTSQWTDVVIPPGEVVELPAEFDNAIQRVRDGVIYSGQAPQLVNLAEPDRTIHPALVAPDPQAARKPSATRERR